MNLATVIVLILLLGAQRKEDQPEVTPEPQPEPPPPPPPGPTPPPIPIDPEEDLIPIGPSCYWGGWASYRLNSDPSLSQEDMLNWNRAVLTGDPWVGPWHLSGWWFEDGTFKAPNYDGRKWKGSGSSTWLNQDDYFADGHIQFRFRERAAKWYGGDETDWWIYKVIGNRKVLLVQGTHGEVGSAVQASQLAWAQFNNGLVPEKQGSGFSEDLNNLGQGRWFPSPFYSFCEYTAQEPFEVLMEESSWIEFRNDFPAIVEAYALDWLRKKVGL